MAGKKIAVKGWKLRGGLPIPSSYQALVDLKSPAFFQTTFTAQSSRVGPNPILRFDTATLSRGTIFLNGHCLGRYPSTLKDDRKPLGMYLPECWFAPDGKNTLVVFEEEGRSPAQAQIQVEMAASREVIAVSKPTDSQSPIQLPPFKPVDLRKDAQLNTATDRPVTASSSLPDNEASNANDADGQSTWMPASPPTEDKPVWLQIDLQQPRHLVSCEIFWKAGKPSNPYLVEGSSDGKKWRLLVDKRKLQEAKDGGGRSFDQVPDGANTRYLRATIFHGFDPKKPTGIDEIRAWDVQHN